MALSQRLNIYENYSVGCTLSQFNLSSGGFDNGSLYIQGQIIPGSISFNTIAVLFSASGTTAKTATISFGLYSLNGSTLSLANSASNSTAPTANTGLWITLSTSATQDITPGVWYFAYIGSASSNSQLSLFANGNQDFLSAYGGGFVRGFYTATTGAFPASIATSDMSKEGTSGAPTLHALFPYILIAA